MCHFNFFDIYGVIFKREIKPKIVFLFSIYFKCHNEPTKGGQRLPSEGTDVANLSLHLIHLYIKQKEQKRGLRLL